MPEIAIADSAADNERNKRVQTRWDELRAQGKHGYYETLFRVVMEEVVRAQNESYTRGMIDQHDDPLSDESIERLRAR